MDSRLFASACLLAATLLRSDLAFALSAHTPTPAEDISTLLDEHMRAQARVEALFATAPDLHELMCKTPSAVGFVSKAANVRIPSSAHPSGEDLSTFRRNHMPVYDTCQIWISEEWKFIYISQPRASSKRVKRAVRLNLCKGRCRPEQWRLAKSHDELEPLLQEYLVFTFVRNPWTRALSTYSMFHSSFLFRQPKDLTTVPDEQCGMAFEAYTEDAARLRDLCDSEQCCCYIPSRMMWMPNFFNIHASDQSHCVFLPNGEPVVDYIGLTETFEDSWTEVIDEIMLRGSADPGESLDGGVGDDGAARRKSIARNLKARVLHANAGEIAGPDADAALAATISGTRALGSSGSNGGTGSVLAGTWVTVWHQTPALHDDAGGARVGGSGNRTAWKPVVEKQEVAQHACNSTRVLHYVNGTTALNIARQFALDVVRLGYL